MTCGIWFSKETVAGQRRPTMRFSLVGWCALFVLSTAGSRAEEMPAGWPGGSKEQVAEDVFGVRFRQMLEIDGKRAALDFLQKEFQRAPRPPVKAYQAWILIYGQAWGYPEIVDQTRGLQLAEEAANEGSNVARDVLARAKGAGIGGPADPAQVTMLLALAARDGATRSMARLGYYYALGYGVPADLAVADRLARRAAELGQPNGLLEIGQAFEDGRIGGIPDFERAMGYYYEASCHGDSSAWAKLKELEKKNVPRARLYHALGYVREANRAAWIAPTRVREHVRTLTELAGEHPQALVELGRAHVDGVYAKTDYKLARSCFERAAKQGNIDAEFFLAKMKLRGFGEKASPAEGLAEIRRLADQGNGEAANYLGYLLYWAPSEAPGIEKSPEKAFAYVRQAAEKGHPFALANLGFCYEHGIGTPVNYALAAKVYWQAFTRGFVDARNRVRRIMPFVRDE